MGTAYFKLHSTGFETSPESHYMNFVDSKLTVKEQHLLWLDNIWQTIWDRVKFDNEMIALDNALLLHWNLLGAKYVETG